jgi:hypothetical protein
MVKDASATRVVVCCIPNTSDSCSQPLPLSEAVAKQPPMFPVPSSASLYHVQPFYFLLFPSHHPSTSTPHQLHPQLLTQLLRLCC